MHHRSLLCHCFLPSRPLDSNSRNNPLLIHLVQYFLPISHKNTTASPGCV